MFSKRFAAMLQSKIKKAEAKAKKFTKNAADDVAAMSDGKMLPRVTTNNKSTRISIPLGKIDENSEKAIINRVTHNIKNKIYLKEK